MRRHTAGKARFDRVLGATAVTGLSLILVIGVVFAISNGARTITNNAVDLHKADESLRSATVVRAQISLAAYMASVDDHFGTVTLEPRQLSQDEAASSLDDLARGIQELEEDEFAADTRIVEAADNFANLGGEILEALETGDVASVRAMVDGPFPVAFQELTTELVVIRNRLATHIDESDSLLGRIGDVARFLVAFFIPAAIILVYRELAQRRHKEADLEHSLESERRLARYREEFIANASHELRTPLTGIVGMSMLAEEDPVVQESPMLREIMHTITSEAHDLSRMVEDLLTTARLDAGALHYVFEDVPIVDEVEIASAGLKSTGLNVTIDCAPAVVRADRTRLRQVVRNLLSNALKYGGPNVRVSGRSAETTYMITVSDDGEGLAAEVEERLFERFVHADRPVGTVDSVGLGLSIVQALVMGMGGAVSYERTEGETSFIVRMPLAVSNTGGDESAPVDPWDALQAEEGNPSELRQEGIQRGVA